MGQVLPGTGALECCMGHWNVAWVMRMLHRAWGCRRGQGEKHGGGDSGYGPGRTNSLFFRLNFYVNEKSY